MVLIYNVLYLVVMYTSANSKKRCARKDVVNIIS